MVNGRVIVDSRSVRCYSVATSREVAHGFATNTTQGEGGDA